jgi:hypothetical protein
MPTGLNRANLTRPKWPSSGAQWNRAMVLWPQSVAGNRESRFDRDPGMRGIGNPDLAGIGKINPDARASGIWWSGHRV